MTSPSTTSSQPPHRATDARARLALVVGVCAISFAAIFFRLAAPTHPLVASAVRLGIAALVLSPVVWRALSRGALARDHAKWALAAGALYALHFGAWVWSLTLTSVAASVTLVTATPLMLALVSLVTGRDRPTPRLWLSLGVASVGILVIGWSDLSVSRDALVGDALALVGALAMGLYLLGVRRLGDVHTLGFMGIACGSGALILGALALATGCPLDVTPGALGYLALAAALPQLVGHTLLTWSVRHVTPTVAGLATLGEPVGAAALGYLWLGERVGGLTALGCAITLAALGVSLSARSTQPERADRA